MKKGEAGPWAMTAFRVMARLKFLRGTWLDPFRNSDERKLERRLIAEFEADVADLTQRLTPASHPVAVRVVERLRDDPRIRTCERGERRGGGESAGRARSASSRPARRRSEKAA